jgi:hypothetical protein
MNRKRHVAVIGILLAGYQNRRPDPLTPDCAAKTPNTAWTKAAPGLKALPYIHEIILKFSRVSPIRKVAKAAGHNIALQNII